MFKEQFFNANGVQINYAQAPSSGCPVVLLHGVTSEWQSFLPLVPELARMNYIYALDLRGHGRSSRVANGYRLMDYAQDIYHFLHRQVAQQAIVYGHSLGALIAIAVAAQLPANVIGLILGEPPLFYQNTTLKESVWYEPFAELHHMLRSMHSAQEIDDHIAQHYPNMDPESRKARANCLSRVDPDAVAMILDHRHMEGYDTDFLLRQIACPVLIFQGNPALGAAARDEDIAYAIERLQNCEVVHMQDVGHGLPPDGQRHEIMNFLKSIQCGK